MAVLDGRAPCARGDLEYVNDQSLRLDLSILRRTVRAVFSGEGAH